MGEKREEEEKDCTSTSKAVSADKKLKESGKGIITSETIDISTYLWYDFR